MIWQNASYLWFLILIPLLAGGIWWAGYHKKTRLSRYFDDRLISRLRTGFWERGGQIKTVLLLCSFFFFIVGLGGPSIGTEVREIEQQGVDMLILLDLSRSMNAEDIRPSRLEKAKFEIQRVIDRLPGDRIGLIVFTGDAFVQSPVTQDHSALRMFLDIAGTRQMPNTTTRFDRALERALETFRAMELRQDAARVILLVSDGEDQGEGYTQPLSALTSEGVVVFTAGIGTPSGGRIPIYEEGSNRLIGYHRDRQGSEVITRLESNVLQEIARRGNGRYYSIENTRQGLDGFLADMDDLQRGEYGTQAYADYRDRYQLLLMIGLAFFVAGLLFPEYRNGGLEEVLDSRLKTPDFSE